MDHQQVFHVLAQSKLFQEFQGAFEHAAGVCITFEPPQAYLLPRRHPTDSVDLRFFPLELKLDAGSDLPNSYAPLFLDWAPGIFEVIASVCDGQQLFGILRTGCVSETKLTRRQLQKLAAPGAIQSKTAADLNLCIHLPVLSRSLGVSIGKILIMFADSLGQVGNRLVLQQSTCEPVIISRAKTFIKINHRENLLLEDVADYAHVSTFYLCKLFKKTTGLNFSEFLTRTRIETAKEMLLNQTARINEVALSAGFQSLTNFNRVFKQLVGKSPRDFRKQTVL